MQEFLEKTFYPETYYTMDVEHLFKTMVQESIIKANGVEKNTILKGGIVQFQIKNILLNFLGFQKIKSFGVGTILLNTYILQRVG